MFDLGIGELLVIGVFALIFVGPKDFTKMFRELGKFTAKLRKMARDFQRAMEDAADESGMRETASSLRKMTSAKELGLDAVKDAAKGWDPTKPSEKAKSIGPETAKMAEERAEQVAKVKENMAKKGQEKLDAAKAAAEAEAKKKAAEPAPEVKGKAKTKSAATAKKTPTAATEPKPKPKAKPKAKPEAKSATGEPT